MLASIFSLNVIQTALELGCIYALVALALFLSYSILNIADLSTDGCFTLGCAVACQVALTGHPFLALLAAMAAGVCSGFITAFLQTRLGVESIMAGIIVNTGLYTINLAVMGFSSTMSLVKTDTVFSIAKSALSFTGGGYKLVLAAAIDGYSDPKALPQLAKQYRVDEIYVAIPSAPAKERKKILEICRETDCKIKMLPGIYQLLNGEVSVAKLREGQIEDLLGEIRTRIDRGERALVTTLTVKMAEDLTDYLEEHGVKTKYMHHEVDTFERMEIIKDLRVGAIDVIVGINLLREGLDLPEVSLIAILDADKEGFLRSETSLIQTIGRAARNANGVVLMYADEVTPSMERAIMETERRRAIQDAYNKAHGIVPKTIIKSVRDLIEISSPTAERKGRTGVKMTKVEKEKEIARLDKQMKEAAKMMEYEYAAVLRDQIIELRGNGT